MTVNDGPTPADPGESPRTSEPLTQALATQPLGGGEFAIDLGKRWMLPWGALFGGAMMAAPLAAVDAHLDGRHILTASCHFLRSGDVGPAVVSVDSRREGRTTSTVHATMHQADRSCVEVVATLGPSTAGTQLFADPPPELPARAECTDPRTDGPGFSSDWIFYSDAITSTDRANFLAGETLNVPRLAAWLRLRDDEVLDAARLALVADNWPPPPWLLGNLGVMRTIELNIQLLRNGHRGWLLAEMRSRALADDLFTAEGMLWAEDGVPLGQWRQVALFEPMPS